MAEQTRPRPRADLATKLVATLLVAGWLAMVANDALPGGWGRDVPPHWFWQRAALLAVLLAVAWGLAAGARRLGRRWGARRG